MDNLDKLFCVQCGSQSLILKKPDGDTHVRTVCKNCNHIIYQNPKIVTGSVCSYKDKILLCKRAIDPQKGLWTLPAGYLEINESIEEGAVREAYEEAFAKIQIVRLLATYSLKHISQIQVIYEAKLLNEDIKAGIESLEVGLFGWDEIPWDQLAFESVRWALRNFKERQNSNTFVVFNNSN